MNSKRYTVTSALLYANGPVHIGHVAGAYLPADIYVRYLKLNENDVVFICGSDEHGAAITLQAKKEGITPKKIIDKYHNLNKKTFEDFGINFSIYHRTSSKVHHETASEFFENLDNKNVFVKKTTQQFYDNKNKQFLADRYIKGECPKCGYIHAYGDQCESCGTTLSPEELINPKSTLSGETPEKKNTTHWYLPMQKHENWLKKWIETGDVNGKKQHDPKTWRKQVLGQCKSWIEGGLRERAMTRDLDWGVKVPLKNAEGKVLYVWLDAPIGYISATKQWAKDNNKKWKPYWKEKDTQLIHFIGKDNIVFHSIIFPIILKSHGEYILPSNVPANEFLNLEGKKLSTSRNWAIWLKDYLVDFKGKQDSLRYALCATSPEGKDTDFTWLEFQSRNNNELVAIYGNYINRVFVLINKYWQGVVPKAEVTEKFDEEVLLKLSKYPEKVGAQIKLFKFREALSLVMGLARTGNKYLADTEPWKLKNIDESRVKTIMNISIQIVSSLAILSEPFLPFTSKKLKKILNAKDMKWENAGKIYIHDGHKIEKPTHLFEKIENKDIEYQLKKLNN